HSFEHSAVFVIGRALLAVARQGLYPARVRIRKLVDSGVLVDLEDLGVVVLESHQAPFGVVRVQMANRCLVPDPSDLTGCVVLEIEAAVRRPARRAERAAWVRSGRGG